ncbi:MAG: cobyrinic acid a,c-diamide synthase, partial [Alphaproteobacteria bacterium]
AYPHLLDAWHEAGAQIIPFSPLAGEAPDPDADAVYLPGGYPELHAGALSACTQLFAAIRQRAEAGALVYGECGGFMVLGEGLIDAEGVCHAMAGLLPFATSFAEPKLHLGYRRLAHAGALPWPRRLRGHEFHYSRLVAQDDGAPPLFEVEDSRGRSLGPAGLRLGPVLGSYIHVVDGEGSGDTG